MNEPPSSILSCSRDCWATVFVSSLYIYIFWTDLNFSVCEQISKLLQNDISNRKKKDGGIVLSVWLKACSDMAQLTSVKNPPRFFLHATKDLSLFTKPCVVRFRNMRHTFYSIIKTKSCGFAASERALTEPTILVLWGLLTSIAILIGILWCMHIVYSYHYRWSLTWS